ESRMKPPVTVLRLPRGPEPNNEEEEQQMRSKMREQFLRVLLLMAHKRVDIELHGKLRMRAQFGTSDIDVLNFQVSDLETPLGVQKEALLRCNDLISCSFEL
ncbi:hypothetical protein DNTS_003568, partial [Danionella cerebrum]